jgi:hypothetical protein
MSDTVREYLTGLQNAPDSQQLLQAAGGYGQGLVAELLPKYAEFAKRGWVFAARSGAAAAIPIYSTSTNSPTLWNPSSSGRLVIPLKVMFTHASGAINAFTGFVVCAIGNTGDTAATGLPFATFTNIASINMLLGRGAASTSKFANAAVTWTVQPTPIMDIGMGTTVQGGANGEPYTMSYDFDGSLMVPPGNAINIAGALASGTALFWTTIVFAEIQNPVAW